MASIKGDISVMPVTDLLQWIDLTRKTVTIKSNTSEFMFSVFKSIEEKKIVPGNNS
jgi:hypothetical protein